MTDPRIVFKAELESGQALCLLPLGRVLVERPQRIAAGLAIYPPYFFKPEDLRVVSYPAYEYREIQRRGYSDSLPWAQSAATRLDLSAFLASALLALPIDFDWPAFFSPAEHAVHLEMIARAASKAERVLDILRFYHCRIDLPQTLPGPAGYLEQEGFSAAQFYSLSDHESYVIAGQIVSHVPVIGVGLDLDGISNLNVPEGGRVGNLAAHGLRLYSAALAAPDDTSKFVQLMTLLEFLADPDAYRDMKSVKRVIARHVSRDRTHYHEVVADFKVLSSDGRKSGETPANQGLRHNIVHLGKRLEDLLDTQAREKVLNRVAGYAQTTLLHFIERGYADWNEIHEYRHNRGKALGL